MDPEPPNKPAARRSQPQKDSETFIYLDDDGLMREVNIHTGEERALESKVDDEEANFFTRYKLIATESGDLVYVPKNTPMESLKKIQGDRVSKPYSPLLADIILRRVTEGELLVRICKDPKMPSYSAVRSWLDKYEDFKERYLTAVRHRAENFLVKALDVIEGVPAERDEINLAKIQSDVYRYIAKVGDPESFTEKQSIKADVAVTGYTVETGIRRPGDPGFNKDESRDVTPKGELDGRSEKED